MPTQTITQVTQMPIINNKTIIPLYTQMPIKELLSTTYIPKINIDPITTLKPVSAFSLLTDNSIKFTNQPSYSPNFDKSNTDFVNKYISESNNLINQYDNLNDYSIDESNTINNSFVPNIKNNSVIDTTVNYNSINQSEKIEIMNSIKKIQDTLNNKHNLSQYETQILEIEHQKLLIQNNIIDKLNIIIESNKTSKPITYINTNIGTDIYNTTLEPILPRNINNIDNTRLSIIETENLHPIDNFNLQDGYMLMTGWQLPIKRKPICIKNPKLNCPPCNIENKTIPTYLHMNSNTIINKTNINNIVPLSDEFFIDKYYKNWNKDEIADIPLCLECPPCNPDYNLDTQLWQ